MTDDSRASSRSIEPIPYRRLDPPSSADWLFVGSFSSIAAWHQAKALLQRHGILTRMGDSPYDTDATNLLVPAQHVHRAADLIRQSGIGGMDQVVSLTLLESSHVAAAGEVANGESSSDQTMQVLDYHAATALNDPLSYRFLIIVMSILLAVIVTLVLLWVA